jgi:hypothetical protein
MYNLKVAFQKSGNMQIVLHRDLTGKKITVNVNDILQLVLEKSIPTQHDTLSTPINPPSPIDVTLPQKGPFIDDFGDISSHKIMLGKSIGSGSSADVQTKIFLISLTVLSQRSTLGSIKEKLWQ